MILLMRSGVLRKTKAKKVKGGRERRERLKTRKMKWLQVTYLSPHVCLDPLLFTDEPSLAVPPAPILASIDREKVVCFNLLPIACLTPFQAKETAQADAKGSSAGVEATPLENVAIAALISTPSEPKVGKDEEGDGDGQDGGGAAAKKKKKKKGKKDGDGSVPAPAVAPTVGPITNKKKGGLSALKAMMEEKKRFEEEARRREEEERRRIEEEERRAAEEEKRKEEEKQRRKEKEKVRTVVQWSLIATFLTQLTR